VGFSVLLPDWALAVLAQGASFSQKKRFSLFLSEEEEETVIDCSQGT
jgi:hypothetical protein